MNIKNLIISLILLSVYQIFAQEEVQIIKPGAPGQNSEIIGEEQAIQIADSSYTKADVDFLQGMIMHHEQAILMSSFVQSRTNSKNINDLAGRIDASQKDEIDFMQAWLDERDEQSTGMMKMMKGMATEYQLNELQASLGVDFDRQFLQLMINHHDGAVEMVEELRGYRGSAYDPVLNQFVSDLVNDQGVEIERMNLLLTDLSDDPRAGLSAGLYTAEEAILNLELVATLKKPSGFFDPKNPEMRGSEDPDAKDDEEELTIEESSRKLRSPMLSFSNTDMAFKDNLLIAGSYHGFNIYELQENGVPNLITSVVCPGGQGDVSVVEDILIMSVEETRGRVDCGLDGVGPDPSPERFRGIRIFDISDIRKPRQVGAVQTCRGSHTHSVVAGPTTDNKIVVYNSGTGSVREEDELKGCIGSIPGDVRTAYFSIDVIEIPIENPANSRIVSSPRVFADNDKGIIGGLWRGGDHGDGTQDTRPTNQCHDITVFPSAGIAAGACSGNGILFDISDPYNPVRIDAVTDPGFAYWHSATFNNDGTKVVFTDEWGGGGRARCRAWDPLTWGADAIYDIEDGKLIFKSHYKMPAPQSESENCVAHNGSIIPIPGRDIFVQAWYQGGMSIMDFTDSLNPTEIAYFDRGPIFEDTLTTGGYWSTYFYEGFIYGTEITRGLDVFKLTPSEFVTKEEIAAAENARPALGPDRVFNPQQQIPMTWGKAFQ
ncbi:DUF305 domain-containing protein [SAR86 cluster bacterium]|nr:DUF305 domain-containing protein [SAR86 cluster bacterium]